jgi:hypothetical protein
LPLVNLNRVENDQALREVAGELGAAREQRYGHSGFGERFRGGLQIVPELVALWVGLAV